MRKWIFGIAAFILVSIGMSQIVSAETISADGNYTYTVNTDGSTCTIIDYNADESIVTIPESIDGYTVTNIGTVSHVPFLNKSMTKIYYPDTVTYICQGSTYGCQNLTGIYKDYVSGSEYYDVDGVLYRTTKLWQYPTGKTDETYVISTGTTEVYRESFNNPQYLKTVIIPETVSYVGDAAFQGSVNSLNIIFKNNTITSDLLGGSFYNLASGSTVTVKTAALKTTADAIMSVYGYGNTTVVVNTYPSTSLTFTDGSTEKSVTWDANSSYSLYDLYNMTSSTGYTTDTVTWTVSDSNMGSVNNDTQYATTGERSGDFDLVGTSDSGYSITLHVKVYVATTSCTAPSNQTVMLNESRTATGEFKLTFNPITAYAAANVTWTSSNTNVLTIKNVEERTGDNSEGVVIVGSYTAKYPGQTTIKATVNDNGTIYTKSFVVTVDSDYYLPNHYYFAYDMIQSSYEYTGSAITPRFLIENKDYAGAPVSYSTSYSNNVNVGTATVKVTGTGSYFGSISKTFKIVKTTTSTDTDDSSTETTDDTTNTSTEESSSEDSTTTEDDTTTTITPSVPVGTSFVSAAMHYTVISNYEVRLTDYSGSRKYITIPSTVSYNGVSFTVRAIGSKAFYKYTKLKSVEIPSTVVAIGYRAFYRCTNLKQITLHNGLQTIDNQAFLRCYDLKSLDIPDTVTRIKTSAFAYCDALEDVNLGAGLEAIYSKAFYKCSSIKEIKFPNNVIAVGTKAFYRCTSLKKVSFGYSVQKIKGKAFYGCYNIYKIDFKTYEAPDIYNKAFEGVTKKVRIYRTPQYQSGNSKKTLKKLLNHADLYRFYFSN